MAAPTNPHELAARWRKAALIAGVLLKCDCGPEDARQMDYLGWINAAELADVNPPSPATRLLVIEILGVAHAA